jgi:hypothetical protein
MTINMRILKNLIFTAALVLASNTHAAPGDAESCSKEELLEEECEYENAVQKRDCLKAQIAKFEECERKVAALDQELAEKIIEKSKKSN